EGHIAWAISTDRQEGLRAFLARDGIITDAQWAEAEERSREGTLRQTLMDMELVTPRQLAQVEKGRAEEIVMELFSALEGDYRVRERQLPPGTPDLQIDVRPLLLRGMLERADRSVILQEVGSLDSIFTARRAGGETGSTALPGEFQSILRHADGKTTIAEICSATSLPDYFVCSAVAALSLTGHLKRSQDRAKTSVSAAEARPFVEPPAEETLPEAVAAEIAAPHPAPEPLELPPINVRPSLPESPRSNPVLLDYRWEEDDEEPAPEIADAPVFAPEEPEEAVLLLADEEEPAEVDATEDWIGEPVRPETEVPAGESPSIYGSRPESAGARPWFLLGGATAVGVAALSLILMTQGQGGAEELPRPAAVPAGLSAEYPDNAEDTDGADVAVAGKPEAPAAPSREAVPSLEGGAKPNILSSGTAPDPSQRARMSLASGDYPAAARYFGRVAATRSNDYTIQLLMACREETLRRTVDNAGGAPDLFILAASHAGKDCYRVFWGSYQTKTRATEALRRDLPRSLRQDRDPPKVRRLGDL
ncbi:MAG TPA: hypothetical protein VFG76_08435, partial [Candidatus Polarisedimenticolia bacterium]|nr:hypothetical protein [Candidatus Polarisedimenticolia bacterium]